MKAEGGRSQAKTHQLAAMSQHMMQLAVEENAHGEELVTQADNSLKGMPMEKPTVKKEPETSMQSQPVVEFPLTPKAVTMHGEVKLMVTPTVEELPKPAGPPQPQAPPSTVQPMEVEQPTVRRPSQAPQHAQPQQQQSATSRSATETSRILVPQLTPQQVKQFEPT